jgi:hypothetical protein
MDDFEVFKIDNEKYNVLIIMKTYEAPFQFLGEMSKKLKKIN